MAVSSLNVHPAPRCHSYVTISFPPPRSLEAVALMSASTLREGPPSLHRGSASSNAVTRHPGGATPAPCAHRPPSFTLPGHPRSSCRGPPPEAPLKASSSSALLPERDCRGPHLRSLLQPDWALTVWGHQSLSCPGLWGPPRAADSPARPGAVPGLNSVVV